MAHVAKVSYEGHLRTVALHLKSGDRIMTDAPTDNRGKGEAFSPTDLASTSLASCMITIMGIKAKDLSIDLDKVEVKVDKEMLSNPRRIGKIGIQLTISASVPEKFRDTLETAAKTCPVALSLHPDIKQEISFEYK